MNILLKNQEINEDEQKIILPLMKEYYDGYKFSLYGKEQIYNSNMCLYFLKDYIRLGRFPQQLIDMNIASDYKKLGNMLDLCKSEDRENVIEKTVSGEGIISDITEKFNPAMDFTEKDLVSMLYYLGYLTINEEKLGKPELKIPNRVMKELYSDYFLQILSENADFYIKENDYNNILEELALEGKINKLVELVQNYLENLSNRDFIKFDEKYIKLIFFCIAMNLKIYRIKSEMEIKGKYPDLLLIPKEVNKGYKGGMIEFKYLKKDDAHNLQEKQNEAKEQILEYANFEEIKDFQNINYYTVVAVNDKLYIESVN